MSNFICWCSLPHFPFDTGACALREILHGVLEIPLSFSYATPLATPSQSPLLIFLTFLTSKYWSVPELSCQISSLFCFCFFSI